MQLRNTKAAALLGGVASLLLFSTYILRPAAKSKQVTAPCAPRLLEREQAECDPVVTRAVREQLAELSFHSN